VWSLHRAYLAAIDFAEQFFKLKPLWVKEISSIQMPETTLEIDQILRALCYQAIGGLQFKLRTRREIAEDWLYISQNGETYVAAADLGKGFPVVVQFATCFADDSVIETCYPVGENIKTARFQSRFAAHSLVGAHNYHLQQIASCQPLHGRPYITRTIADIRQQNAIYRKAYQRRRNMRYIVANVTIIAVCIGFSLSAVMLWLAYFLPETTVVIAVLFPVMMVLFVIAINGYLRLFKYASGAIDEKGADKITGGRGTN
jgi:hypothetical protein